jgi:hypothetical protein
VANWGLRDKLRGLFDSVVIGFYEKLDSYNRSKDVREAVKTVRQLPASDRDKKIAMARFFQDEGGGRFSREEKRKAYDDLLGERNKRQLG